MGGVIGGMSKGGRWEGEGGSEVECFTAHPPRVWCRCPWSVM